MRPGRCGALCIRAASGGGAGGARGAAPRPGHGAAGEVPRGGCDGRSSAVRGALGISYPGKEYPQAFFLVEMQCDPQELRAGGFVHSGHFMISNGSLFLVVRLKEGHCRIIHCAVGIDERMTVDDMRAAWERIMPMPIPASATFQHPSFFRVSCRIADRYRQGRSFLAGDAAHCHSPAGGQGMNTGLQDATNLAWKLAAALRGHSGEALLDSYEAERRPVAEWVLERSDGLFRAIMSASPAAAAVRGLLARAVLPLVPGALLPPASARIMLFGLGHSYAGRGACVDAGPPPGRGAVVAGNRLPDCACVVQEAGSQQETSLLRLLCPLRLRLRVLLLGAAPDAAEALLEEARAASAWPLDVWCCDDGAAPHAATRLQLVDDGLRRALRLPPRGAAVLVVRPDGHIAAVLRGPLGGDAGALAGLLRGAGLAVPPRARL